MIVGLSQNPSGHEFESWRAKSSCNICACLALQQAEAHLQDTCALGSMQPRTRRRRIAAPDGSSTEARLLEHSAKKG